MDKPLISLLFPLYKSKKHLDNIKANIDAVRYENVEFLIGDRHCYDDTIDVLKEHYAGDPRFIFFETDDKKDWRVNTNALIDAAKGDYYRFMPHDDYFEVCGLEEMVKMFEKHPDTIVVYSPVKYFGLNDPERRMFDLEKPVIYPNDKPWTFQTALDFVFDKLGPASFRGLKNLKKIKEHNVLIEDAVIASDIYYLFALAILGRFTYTDHGFSERAYSTEGASGGWRGYFENHRFKVHINAYKVQSNYLDQLVTDKNMRRKGKWYLGKKHLQFYLQGT